MRIFPTLSDVEIGSNSNSSVSGFRACILPLHNQHGDQIRSHLLQQYSPPPMKNKYPPHTHLSSSMADLRFEILKIHNYKIFLVFVNSSKRWQVEVVKEIRIILMGLTYFLSGIVSKVGD